MYSNLVNTDYGLERVDETGHYTKVNYCFLYSLLSLLSLISDLARGR